MTPIPHPTSGRAAGEPADTASPPVGAPLGPRVRWARRALVLDTVLLTAALLGQVFTAGLAVFVGAGWWLRHLALVHAFQWLSPLALGLAYLARAPRAVQVLAGLTVALLWLQYGTADLRLVPGRQGWAALHSVGAMLLFWTSTELARRAWRLSGVQG